MNEAPSVSKELEELYEIMSVDRDKKTGNSPFLKNTREH